MPYVSDGLKVVGFIVKPHTSGAASYPVIVYNRGGFRDIGKIDAWNLLDFYGFASHGFVVLASQYRGNDGGEGRDEVGGADVADVMALAQLARQLPYADPANMFVYGLSRGGMMSFLALKRGFPAKAAAVVGAVFDVEAFSRRSPQVSSHGSRDWFAVDRELVPGHGVAGRRAADALHPVGLGSQKPADSEKAGQPARSTHVRFRGPAYSDSGRMMRFASLCSRA